MALERCPACNRKLSTKAESCPHCGDPLNGDWVAEQVRRRRQTIFLWWVAIVGGILVVVFWDDIFGARGTSTSVSTQPSAEDVYVTASQYGTDWPYEAYTEGWISCHLKTFGNTKRPLVTIKLAGREYGLNGAAFGVGGYPNARQHLNRHPEFDHYLLGATTEFIQIGLKLCDR